MRATPLELIEFAVVMAQEFPKVIPGDLAELCRLSRRHHALQERACNTSVKEDHDAACEKKIFTVCKNICPDIVPLFSGDPRGCTVKLRVPSKRTNDFGAVGICVPQ